MFIKTLCDLATAAQSVQLNVMKLEGGIFQVVIQPSMQLAEKYPALAQPLMVTESAENLQAELVKALTSFTPMIQTAANNLAQIQDELDTAQKAAREKGKKPATTGVPAKPAAAGGTTTTSGVKPTAAMEKGNDSAPDLFSSGPTTEQSNPPANAGVAAAPGSDQQDEEEDALPTLPGM